MYQTDVDAFDPDNDTVSYSLITAPANMTIDLASGLISWTPINSQVGINQVTVQASDNNLTSLQLFTITVANTNDDPTLTQNIPDQTWNEDNNLTINLSNYFQDLVRFIKLCQQQPNPTNSPISKRCSNINSNPERKRK
ncbi:putative Ig domain-containing protein [Candidatus Woesearchaeota archaeon]|nr:putative Ig domain-containing protein [Candidatus Woesearchaeota archaeon]